MLSPSKPSPMQCLTANAYQEARGEGTEGMIGVTNVVMNRVGSKAYPNSVCKVVFQPYQFSWTLVYNHTSFEITEEDKWNEALAIATAALDGELPDLVKGARFYYNPNKVNPDWAKKMKEATVINNHRYVDYPKQLEIKQGI